MAVNENFNDEDIYDAHAKLLCEFLNYIKKNYDFRSCKNTIRFQFEADVTKLGFDEYLLSNPFLGVKVVK